MHVLGHLSIEEFLRDYWQQKPVLIRKAIPNFAPLLPADELAGLSLEEDIESRLIIEEGKSGPWEIRKGPFTEADYRSLPENKWTLLLQAVDQLIPEAADLLEHFRFIPSWRIDDLMISLATDGGSVGPHYDQYDVFLLQAQGHRRWTFGGHCDHPSPRVEGTPLRTLSSWDGGEPVTLAPGCRCARPRGIGPPALAQGENCDNN